MDDDAGPVRLGNPERRVAGAARPPQGTAQVDEAERILGDLGRAGPLPQRGPAVARPQRVEAGLATSLARTAPGAMSDESTPFRPGTCEPTAVATAAPRRLARARPRRRPGSFASTFDSLLWLDRGGP